MKTFFLFMTLLPLSLAAQQTPGAINLQSQAVTAELPNETGTGTTAKRLVRTTGAPSKVIKLTTQLTGIFGICVSSCGTTGTAQIAVQGQATCTFDNTTVANDYVQASGTDDRCHDAGAIPTNDVVGIVLASGAAGDYLVEVFGPGAKAAFTGDLGSGGTSGLVPAPATGDASPLKFLGADGTWDLLSNVGTSSTGQVLLNTTGAVTGVTNATTPAGVSQFLLSNPSVNSGVPAFGLMGIVPNAQVGTSYTVLATDRGKYLSTSSASAIAVTLPAASSAGFTSNFNVFTCNIGSGTATWTPTTSTISYSNSTGYTAGAATMPLTPAQCANIVSDGTNYFARITGEAPINSSGDGGFFSNGIPDGMQANGANVVAGTNNILKVVEFTLPLTYSIGHATIRVTTAVAASFVSAGIYSADGSTKLVDSGTFDTSTTGAKSNSFTVVRLAKNKTYRFAYCTSDSTVQTMIFNSFTSNSIDLVNNVSARIGNGASTCTAGALPSTTGAITGAAPSNNGILGVFWEF